MTKKIIIMGNISQAKRQQGKSKTKDITHKKDNRREVVLAEVIKAGKGR